MNAAVTSTFLLALFQCCWSFELKHGPIGPGRCGAGIYADPHVVGGTRTKLKNYPWTALLVYRHKAYGTQNFYECGGSLISDQYVLTAAHCVDALNQSYTLNHVRLGEWDIDAEQDCDEWMCNDPPKDVAVESVVVHHKFSRDSYRYDVALLKLKELVSFTNTVSPVCLPTSERLQAYNTDTGRFTVVGWGTTEYRNGTRHFKSRHKREVDLPGVQTKECKQYHTRSIGKSQLCAGGEFGKDTCEGDSGGGLVARRFGYYFIYGIVSYGYDICEMGYPAVYTRVTSFLDWIQANTD